VNCTRVPCAPSHTEIGNSRSRGRGRKPEQTITAGEATGCFCAGRFNPAQLTARAELPSTLVSPHLLCIPVVQTCRMSRAEAGDSQ